MVRRPDLVGVGDRPLKRASRDIALEILWIGPEGERLSA
jgi:hypothetical protein